MKTVWLITPALFTINFFLVISAKKPQPTERDLLPTDETVTFLLRLSENIKAGFDNATGENYDVLLKHLYEYYNNLDDIYCMLTDQEEGVKQNGTRLMARIIDDGQPTHVKDKIDYKNLQFKFAWDDNNVREIKEVVKSTQSLWENCEFLYNEMAFDEFAVPTQNKTDSLKV